MLVTDSQSRSTSCIPILFYISPLLTLPRPRLLLLTTFASHRRFLLAITCLYNSTNTCATHKTIKTFAIPSKLSVLLLRQPWSSNLTLSKACSREFIHGATDPVSINPSGDTWILGPMPRPAPFRFQLHPTLLLPAVSAGFRLNGSLAMIKKLRVTKAWTLLTCIH